MTTRQLEEMIKSDIENIFQNILQEHNYVFPISAKSRSGAEINDYLEDGFAEYVNKNPHKRIYNVKCSPKGVTKNPYDFCFNYRCDEIDFDDLIWGDIKATKSSYADSNLDLGTPEKIIKFILDGHFYLFLKDVNHTVRINSKPQFQVNIHERSFLNFFI